MIFGEEMKKVRKEKHITQDALARKLGINRATVSKYESGVIMPTIAQAERIADALGVSRITLVFGSDAHNDYEAQKKADREKELNMLIFNLMPNEPEDYRKRIVKAFLAFDPNMPGYEILEKIYTEVKKRGESDE